jgi:hypothetical protein
VKWREKCGHAFVETALARIFHELRDVSIEKPACLRQGDVVAVSPDKVGPFGANISGFHEMFGLEARRTRVSSDFQTASMQPG